jgi:hypothetical protein
MARVYYSWIKEPPQNQSEDGITTVTEESSSFLWVCGSSYLEDGLTLISDVTNTVNRPVIGYGTTTKARAAYNAIACSGSLGNTIRESGEIFVGGCDSKANGNYTTTVLTTSNSFSASNEQYFGGVTSVFQSSATAISQNLANYKTTKTDVTVTSVSCDAQSKKQCYTTKALMTTFAPEDGLNGFGRERVSWKGRETNYCFASSKKSIYHSGLETIYSVTAEAGILGPTQSIWGAVESPYTVAPTPTPNGNGGGGNFKEHIGFDLVGGSTYGFEYRQYAPNENAGFDFEDRTFSSSQITNKPDLALGVKQVWKTINITTKVPLYTEVQKKQHFFGYTTFTRKWLGMTTNLVPYGNSREQAALPRYYAGSANLTFEEPWGDRRKYQMKNEVLYTSPPNGIAGFGFPPKETNKAYCSIKINSSGETFAKSQTLTSPFIPISSCEWTGNNGAKILKCGLSFYPTGKCLDFGEQEGTTKWKKQQISQSFGTSTIIEATYSSLIGSDISFRYATYSLSLQHSIKKTFIREAEVETIKPSDLGLKYIGDGAGPFADGGDTVSPMNTKPLTTQIFYCDNTGYKTIVLVEPANYTIEYYSPSGSSKRYTKMEDSYVSRFSPEVNLVAVTMEPLFDVCAREDGFINNQVRAKWRLYVEDTNTLQSVATNCPEIISPEYTCSSF